MSNGKAARCPSRASEADIAAKWSLHGLTQYLRREVLTGFMMAVLLRPPRRTQVAPPGK